MSWVTCPSLSQSLFSRGKQPSAQAWVTHALPLRWQWRKGHEVSLNQTVWPENGGAIIPQRRIKVLIPGGGGLDAEQIAQQMVLKVGLLDIAKKNIGHWLNLNFREIKNIF